MDKNRLGELLKGLIEEYIEDPILAAKLISTLDDPKAKYILTEIELNKSREYTPISKAIIQDIAFYCC